MRTNDKTNWLRRLAGEVVGEEWRQIDIELEYGPFEVSSTGRVRNIRTGYIHRQRLNDGGYPVIRIRKKFYKIHRLVAVAFVPNPNGLATVNHMNGDKTVNSPANLEWCSHAENARHAVLTGLTPKCLGSTNGAAKLTENQVIEIRRRYLAGSLQIPLAREFGVSQRMVSLIVRRERWTHV